MNMIQDDYVPTLKETVAHQLLQLRTARTPNKRKTVAIALLPALEKNPSLASLCFQVGGLFATPLYHYLRAGVDDIPTVQRLCKICSSLPQMHVACENCSAEVIEYLLSQQHPGSMLIRDDRNFFPFDYAMKNPKVSTAAKKKILRLCPEAVGSGYPLYYALSEEYPVDFLEYMVEVWPPTIDTADLGTFDCTELASGFDEVIVLNLAQARILCKLLSKLSRLLLGNISWHYDSCILFLKELQNNTTLKTLACFRLPLMRTESEVRQQELMKLFQAAFLKNTTLGCVDNVIFEKECMRLTSSWISALDEMIFCTHSLKCCYFVNGPKRASGPSVCAEFVACTPKLRFLGLDFTDTTHVKHFHEICARTRFEAINIVSSINAASTGKASGGVTTCMMSKAVVALLGTRHHCFTKLETPAGVFLDMPIIFEALRTNTQLVSLRIGWPEKSRSPNVIAKCLEMLEHHNMTLGTVTPFCRDHPRIQYFLDLNRLGRKAIRDTTSIRTVLCLLVAAQKNGALRQPQNTGSYSSRLQSALYGLLHESLGLWGNNTSLAGCKRKCDARHLSC